MSGSERINTTLLKMLNGLIKPDRGSITMRGRVGGSLSLGSGLHFPSMAPCSGSRKSIEFIFIKH